MRPPLQIIVMVCVYLGPLFTGFWTGLGIQIGVISAIFISCQLYL